MKFVPAWLTTKNLRARAGLIERVLFLLSVCVRHFRLALDEIDQWDQKTGGAIPVLTPPPATDTTENVSETHEAT